MRNKKNNNYYIIIILSFISSLYLFETFLHLRDSITLSNKEKIYKRETGLIYDKRSKFEIYRDLKKEDNKITLSLTSWIKQFLDTEDILPLSGLSFSKSIHCNENGYFSIYVSDRYGFNNPDEDWDKKIIEHVVVGDSFVHGACVNRPNDISSVLRTLSNNGVINLGISGNGPLSEYVTLREYLPSNVKNIIWVYFEGFDLMDLMNEKKNPILMKYLEDLQFSQSLIEKNNIKDRVVTKIIKKEFERISEKYNDDNNLKYKILKFVRLDKTKNSINFNSVASHQIDQAIFKEFELIMSLTKKLAFQNNSNLYFVYLPEYSRFVRKYDNKNYEKIISIIDKLNINLIDLNKEIFEKEKNPLKYFPFGLDAHFNPLGYKVISNTIYRQIKFNR